MIVVSHLRNVFLLYIHLKILISFYRLFVYYERNTETLEKRHEIQKDAMTINGKLDIFLIDINNIYVIVLWYNCNIYFIFSIDLQLYSCNSFVMV